MTGRRPWEHAAGCPGWSRRPDGVWCCPCPRNDEPDSVPFAAGYAGGLREPAFPDGLDRDPDLPDGWEAS